MYQACEGKGVVKYNSLARGYKYANSAPVTCLLVAFKALGFGKFLSIPYLGTLAGCWFI